MECFVLRCFVTGDKYMPGFAYSTRSPFTKINERIKKFMQSGHTGFIYRNELDKDCFQHDVLW